MMRGTALRVRAVDEREIEALEQHLPFGPPTKHRERLDMQRRGEALYLVAWQGDMPVGHVLVVWEGTRDEPMASRLRDCPDVEDLLVSPEHRVRGIGSRLLVAAEDLARQEGHVRIGLGVGVENRVARSLYEHRAYREAGFGLYPHCVDYVDRLGGRHCQTEICSYLIKDL